MKSLFELFTGYADPKTLYVGPAPIGTNGLTMRIHSIAFRSTAIRCLDRRRFYRLAMDHCPGLYRTFVGSMKQACLAEIMRIMDVPSIKRKNVELENLTVRLLSKRFQKEPTISQSDKDEERWLFTALTNEYDNGRYKEFRNKINSHIDLEEALKPPTNYGNIYQITDLILAWFKHVGSVVLAAEPRFATVGGGQTGRNVVKTFRKMMLDQARYRRQKLPGEWRDPAPANARGKSYGHSWKRRRKLG